MNELRIELPPDWLEAVAERAAEILAEREAIAGRANDGFMDVSGAAEYLACPASRIYSLVSAGRIPHNRDGSRLLFDRGELREYVRNGGAMRP